MGTFWFRAGLISLGLSILSWSVFAPNVGWILSTLSFSWQDGHCTPTQSFYGHCFGDLAELIAAGTDGISIISTSLYSPLVQLAYFLAAWATEYVGYKIIAVLLFLVSLSGIAFVMLHATRKWAIHQRITVLISLGVLTAPVISGLDRGNTTLLAIPLIYLAYVYVLRDQGTPAALLLSGAAIIRPQFILLVLSFLLLRRLKPLLLSLAFTTLAYIIGWTLGTFAGLASFLSWISRIWAYQDGNNDGNFPVNIAFAALIRVHRFGADSLSSLSGLASLWEGEYWTSILGDFQVYLAILALIIFFLFATASHPVPPVTALLFPVLLVTLVPNYGHQYYRGLLISVLALILSEGFSKVAIPRFARVVTITAILASLSLIIVPMDVQTVYRGVEIVQTESSVNVVPYTATALLFLTLLSLPMTLPRVNTAVWTITSVVVFGLTIVALLTVPASSLRVIDLTDQREKDASYGTLIYPQDDRALIEFSDLMLAAREGHVYVYFTGRCIPFAIRMTPTYIDLLPTIATRDNLPSRVPLNINERLDLEVRPFGFTFSTTTQRQTVPAKLDCIDISSIRIEDEDRRLGAVLTLSNPTVPHRPFLFAAGSLMFIVALVTFMHRGYVRFRRNVRIVSQ